LTLVRVSLAAFLERLRLLVWLWYWPPQVEWLAKELVVLLIVGEVAEAGGLDVREGGYGVGSGRLGLGHNRSGSPSGKGRWGAVKGVRGLVPEQL
jgi:hypothetical protein